jgi:DNA-binding MarR family transcriptional regulator
MQNTVKKQSNSVVSQFEITSNLLRNLNKFNLTPVTKLVLLELTTHLNENKNGAVVFPSISYIAEVLGIGLTATKKAINDLIKQGLIIKSKRSKIKGNYNMYVLTPKVQNLTSERSKIECFKKSDNDRFFIEQKKETNNTTNVDDFKILKDYAIKHNAKNINAYINFLKKSGSDKQIIKDYKQAKANNKAMLEAVKQNQKDLEFARQNAWQVPEGYFEKIRSQITKNPTSVKMQGLRKEDLLLEE